MSHRRLVRKLRGIALIMALFMALVVVSIVTVLLAWVQYDNSFATTTQMEMRAYYDARSGLDWFRVNGGTVAIPGSTTVAVSSTTDSVTLTVDPTGNLTSVGTVNWGSHVYTRALYVPGTGPVAPCAPGVTPQGLQFNCIRDEGGQ